MSTVEPVEPVEPARPTVPARSEAVGLRDSWPLCRRDALTLVAWFVGLTAVGVAIGLLLTGPLDGTAVTRFDENVSQWFADHRTPTLDDLTWIGSMLADTMVKVGRHRRGRHRHARRLAVVAGAADGRAGPRAGSVDVHRGHDDRRPTASGRRAAGGVAGRQQLPVRPHRGCGRVRRDRRRDLVALRAPMAAHRIGRARRPRRARRRLLPHLPGHAPRHRRRRRRAARRRLRPGGVARSCATGPGTADPSVPRRRHRDRRPRRRPRRGGCRGGGLRRVGVAATSADPIDPAAEERALVRWLARRPRLARFLRRALRPADAGRVPAHGQLPGRARRGRRHRRPAGDDRRGHGSGPVRRERRPVGVGARDVGCRARHRGHHPARRHDRRGPGPRARGGVRLRPPTQRRGVRVRRRRRARRGRPQQHPQADRRSRPPGRAATRRRRRVVVPVGPLGDGRSDVVGGGADPRPRTVPPRPRACWRRERR